MRAPAKRALRSLACAAVAVAAPLVLAEPARAGEVYGPAVAPGWYLPLGVSLGGAFHARGPAGASLGGELSVVHLSDERLFWFGGYVDGLYDTARSLGRMTVGPELGWMVFGLDTGFLAQVGGGRADPGFVIRPVITLGWIGLYARYGHVFSSDAMEDFGEVGLLVKYPILLRDESFPPVRAAR